LTSYGISPLLGRKLVQVDYDCATAVATQTEQSVSEFLVTTRLRNKCVKVSSGQEGSAVCLEESFGDLIREWNMDMSWCD
jgi:hypothetical protein